MKTKRVLIIVEPAGAAFRRAKEVFKTRTKKYAGMELISFPDYATLGRILSATRLQLLAAIRREKPSSIQKLAKAVKRDFKNVYQDLQLLIEFGLVDTKSKGRGKSAQPVAKFSELVLVV